MRLIAALSALFAVLIAASGAQAQGYPSRPITLVVAFPAGAAQDIAARFVGHKLSERVGVPVVIENRPGAAGTTGTAAVARASPDGYTLLFGALGPMVVTPVAKKNLSYDPLRDFTPIAPLTSSPLIMLVLRSSPHKTLADVAAAAHQRPGKMNYASAGIGSLSNFASEQLKVALGLDVVHVPYAGAAPALRALLAGEVDFYLAAANDAIPRIQQGQVRGLLVTLPRRWRAVPDVPSLTDVGLTEPNLDQWFGIFGPAGMAPDVVNKLNDAIIGGMKDPAAAAAIPGTEVTPGTADEFAAKLRADLARVARQVELTGFKTE
ncbi:MAG TPA: tripartite tricarboxylate transporter substrate binding protein [Burkholderiales bacterium]|nr:tripartite tricarboxylate transporter substrate binding protein [Burkholderiales bacterium]